MGSGSDEPFSGPELENEFPGGNGQATPTAEPTPEETSTPEPSPTPAATAKPGGGKRGKRLPDTGSDPLRVGLMGLTLLGFGLSLRLGLAEVQRRN